MSEKTKGASTPLWNRALERYSEELEGNDDFQSITEISSLDDLLSYAKTIEPFLPEERGALRSIQRLGPTLKFVDDFSAIIAVCFGADAKLTAVVWGSIRLMLNLASSGGDTLKDVIEMLEELSLTLPRFRTYEDKLPMDRSLETALVDVYTEVICFYARCIHFFRAHPHVLLRRDAWADFRSDFSRTVSRIRRLSSAVESEAESARLRRDTEKYTEVLNLMENFKDIKIRNDESKSYYYIPTTLGHRFWGREDALESITKALAPEEKPRYLKTFALHGMGGVGKTRIALQYANQNRDNYSAILWVAADNTISIGQSFREIAKVLGLVKGEEEMQDSVAVTLKVKTWLDSARCPWLLVFNNADDLEVLRHVWPANSQGSVLVTTRDASAVHSPASNGFQVLPFDDTTGSEVLLNLLGLESSSSANREKAKAVTETLGGLPLALSQISGFIVQRKLPLQDFLPLYQRHAAKIDARKTGVDDYEHTLSTVWEMSMTKLSRDSQALLGLLPYFQPDAIDEMIFLQGVTLVDDPEFQFLQDEMDIGDEEEALLKAGLIDKNAETAVLSIHRLIQGAVIRTQSKEEKENYFHTVVKILSWGFPDTWTEDVGHQIQAWSKCEKCLPHVHHLVTQQEKNSIMARDPQKYGELLLRCSWYLYERESYDIAKPMVLAALKTFENKGSLAFASAIDLSGLIELDLCQPEVALLPFEQALEIRKSLMGETNPLVASSLNNLALSYTEMGFLDRAYALHEDAIRIRLSADSGRIGNSYSNMSSLLLRMGRADEAEEMLKRCPSLKNFTDETFLKTGNPRFSGDMVLLSRIRLQQGRVDEAVRLASKALAFRQKLLGNRLKTCDSLYDVATLMHIQGNSASAIEFLCQLADIANSIPEGKGQLARAYFKLACLHSERKRLDEGARYKEMAEDLMADLRPDAKHVLFEEAEYMKLCLWMLW